MSSDRLQSIPVLVVAIILQMTTGDYIGWFLFFLGIAAVVIFLYYLYSVATYYRRKKGGYTASDDVLFERIASLDARIRKVEKESRDAAKRYQDQIALLLQEKEELKRQLQENAALRREVEDPQDTPHMPMTTTPNTKPTTRLLIVTGSDSPDLALDIDAARGVEKDTKMRVRLINNADLAKIKEHIDRARSTGKPYSNVHFAVHSDEKGMYLNGQLVTSQQLSEVLKGVDVLLIAGCESSSMADGLNSVDYVVSMTKKVPHKDAMYFSKAFWREIGLGNHPDDALSAAFERSPAVMSEYVEQHW